MAMVESTVWEATLTFVDNDGDKGRTSFYIAGTEAYADAYTGAQAVGAAMQAISNGVLSGITLTRSAYEDALNFQTMSEASEVQRKGVFTFKGVNPAVKTKLEVPSLNSAFVVDGAHVLNVADAAVQAVISAVIANATTNRAEALTEAADTPRKLHRNKPEG